MKNQTLQTLLELNPQAQKALALNLAKAALNLVDFHDDATDFALSTLATPQDEAAHRAAYRIIGAIQSQNHHLPLSWAIATAQAATSYNPLDAAFNAASSYVSLLRSLDTPEYHAWSEVRSFMA